MVGEPFVVAADQRDVDGRLDAVLQRSSIRCWKSVRCSSSIRSSSSSSRRAASTSLVVITSAACAIRRCASWPISRIVRCRSPGYRELGEAQDQGQLGHVLGQVARTLQVRAHPQRGDDDPQVRGDRLLPRQDRNRPVFQVALQVIDLESAEMTLSASERSASRRAVVARPIAEPTSLAISTRPSLIEVELA